MIKQYRVWVALALVLLLALGLRLWGFEWGLPNELHYFSYHPDETVMLIHSTSLVDSQGLNVFAGHFLPHFYNYGTLQLYLINMGVSIESTYGPGRQGGYGHFPIEALRQIYLTGRLLSVAMGVGTVWALFALGARLYGWRVGLMAALLLAVTPLHAQHSHFMTVDVPSTFWVVLALLCAVKGWKEPEGALRSFALAGIFCGLATATKYNTALIVLPVLIAALYSAGILGSRKRETESTDFVASRSKAAGAILVVLAAMATAFLVCCPGSVFEHDRFMADLQFEARHVESQPELWFQKTGIGWVYVVTRNLDTGMGLPLLLMSIAGLIFCLLRQRQEDLLVAAFVLPYYLLVGAAQSRYARYEIPLLPFMAIAAASLIHEYRNLNIWIFKTLELALAVVAIFTLVDCLVLERPLTQIDTRDRAALWLNQHAAAPATLAFPTQPWFWTAAVDPYFNLPGPGEWTTSPRNDSRFLYNAGKAFDTDLLANNRPDIVVLSEYEYDDRLRLRDTDTIEYLKLLKSSYRLAAVFRDSHPLGGQSETDGLPTQDLPHDMMYPSPAILVYARR